MTEALLRLVRVCRHLQCQPSAFEGPRQSPIQQLKVRNQFQVCWLEQPQLAYWSAEQVLKLEQQLFLRAE
jgi:hypothetical protein